MADAHILVVDDETGIVRLCQVVLERAGYTVSTSTDPHHALSVMRSHPFDLLVTDIRMPQMDGFELIARAREIQPEVPVLMMTGFGTIDTAIEALRKGVNGLLLKPFNNSAELVETTRQILEEARQRKDANRLRIIRPLFDLSETLVAQTSPSILLEMIRFTIGRFLQADGVGIYEHCDQTYQLLTGLSDHGNQPEVAVRNYLDDIGRRGTVEITEAQTTERLELAEWIREHGWGYLLSVPVLKSDHTYLFIAARSRNKPRFNDADVDMMTILTRQSVVALENARLYQAQREALERVKESQNALVQSEKMAAVGRLVASVAHEINNPLQSVRNCLHLATRDDIDQKQQQEFIELAQNEVNRLARLVQQMLEFSRPGKGQQEPVDVKELIERLLGIVRPTLRDKHIDLVLDVGKQLPKVPMIRDQIQQVIFNLVINAIEAMESQEGSARKIWLSAEIEERQLVIRVEDSGPGVPPDLAEKIFEPFITGKVNGTGLGLSVSYGIIESHKGTLRLVPPQNASGACFEIRLPVGGQDGERFIAGS